MKQVELWSCSRLARYLFNAVIIVAAIIKIGLIDVGHCMWPTARNRFWHSLMPNLVAICCRGNDKANIA